MPDTRTESPATTVGAEVKTKMPSLVAGLESGSGSWIQKPRLLPCFVRTPVTMPGTLVTCSPLCVASQPESWMSWMRSGPGSPSPVSSPQGLAGGGSTTAAPWESAPPR